MNTVGWIVTGIATVVASGLAYMGAKTAIEERRAGKGDLLQAAADELNRRAPLMVDAHTRLDSAQALPNRTLVHNYTLVQLPASRIDPALSAAFERQVIQATCEQQARNLLAKGVTLVYRYRSADAVLVKGVAIRPKTCMLDPSTGTFSLAPKPR